MPLAPPTNDNQLGDLLIAVRVLIERVDNLTRAQDAANTLADATLAEIKRGNRAAKARANGTPEPKP